MRKILRFLKNIWIVNFLTRVYTATGYFNGKYFQILKWGLFSRERTNFTYHLAQGNLKYLAHTISVVTKIPYPEIMNYIFEIQSDNVLRETILTAINNSPGKKFADQEVRFGRRIGWYVFARAIKPEIVIETGVDKGLGAIVLCAALLKNRDEGYEGKYYGTDINPEAGYILSGKYKEVGTILFGDSITTLAQFPGKVDLFINDSDHTSNYEYLEYQTIKPLITAKTIILGDNSHCNSNLADFSLEMERKFLFFPETPLNHWYPGAGIGISYAGK